MAEIVGQALVNNEYTEAEKGHTEITLEISISFGKCGINCKNLELILKTSISS